MIDLVNYLFSEKLTFFVILFILAQGYVLLQLGPLYFALLIGVLKHKRDYSYKKLIFQLVIGFGLISLIKELINYWWGVPRPYIVFNLSFLDSIYPHDQTLISGHSATSIFLALFSFNFSKKAGYFNLFLALIGSFLRALLLIHWFRDIILGWWLGFIVFFVVWLISQKIY